ncbi:MAG: hypothetical protein ACREBP_02375, partial [Sphingomicrobium sp.]
ASRTPARKVHVLLTMRSDFIGECARFHGLPEAVSATQFLVPSLTRDQLEEVIREPIAKAGATIEPALVERLLNDCDHDLDQLPVLQHCLLRLWQQAGRQPALPAKDPTAAARDGEREDKPSAGRHLVVSHYDVVGRIAGALSLHAEEILADLPGPQLQLAVEQSFRALSELDKDGRAIRRALRFSQLLAETGVGEEELRLVLDRFRADGSSFLIPPPSERPTLAPDTRIDVGHETLLRRWERVSGKPGAVDGADIGWLRAEQRDGETYRVLLSMAESDGGDERAARDLEEPRIDESDRTTLPLHRVEERWKWWNARPRTQAWAERYGGGLERVQRLFDDSLAAFNAAQAATLARQKHQRQVFFTMAAGDVGAMVLTGITGWQWWEADSAKKNAIKAEQNALASQREAEENLRLANEHKRIVQESSRIVFTQTRQSIQRVLKDLQDGGISVQSARTLLG